MIKVGLGAALTVAALGCQGATAPEIANDRPIIGVKIYDTERDLRELFGDWRELGVDTVFAPEELASKEGFRTLAEETGTDLFVIFPVFFAPEELAEDQDLWAVTANGTRAKEDWVEFACPSRADFRNRRIEEAREIVRRLEPDGLSIDFIRDFVFWEMVSPDRDSTTLPDTCYCALCLQGFSAFSGVPALSIPPQPQRAAVWIADNAGEDWIRFKCDSITSMVEEIVSAVRGIKPDILINIHIVPWRTNDSPTTCRQWPTRSCSTARPSGSHRWSRNSTGWRTARCCRVFRSRAPTAKGRALRQRNSRRACGRRWRRRRPVSSSGTGTRSRPIRRKQRSFGACCEAQQVISDQ